jgi:transposase
MDNDGNVREQYDMDNSESSWTGFRAKYNGMNLEIALEVSTTGKYVARKLRDMGFHVHMADPSGLSLIFKTAKKNDREDSYKLAKILRLGELPEVHLPSKDSDNLRSLTRYRRSIGEEITMIKNRIHALLSSYGIAIDATDVFGKKGIAQIHSASSMLSESDRFMLSSMLERISILRDHAVSVEDRLSAMVMDNSDVARVMTVPGISVYSSSAIIAEIDDISRFATKEKLAAYAGLVPRQDQSGNHDIKGHITKHGPSMLRFILVNAAHVVIRYSKRMKNKYLSLVRKLGRNRAIVAIARILLETIYTMLKKGVDFIDQIDTLTERKMKSMKERAKNPSKVKNVEDVIKYIREKRIKDSSKELFS